MFKKHFRRKTKLANPLAANLISFVRRTGKRISEAKHEPLTMSEL